MGICNENFVVIQGWMCNELNLKGNDLLVFALIYGFSQDEKSTFKGGRTYIAETFNISKPTVDRALNNLLDAGLIEKILIEVSGMIFYEYKALQGVKNLYGGGKETLHSNIYNNINNNKENNTYYNSLGSKDNNSSLKTTTKDCSNLKSLEDNIYNNIKSNDKLKEREKTNKREKEKIEDDITEIIEYLNLKAGKNYRTNVESNRSAIRARLNDHYTKEDCIKVIDIKVAKWKGTEYEQYLKVSTLFRPAHFDDYLNESEMLPFEEKKKNDTPEVNQEWRDMWSRA